MGPLQLAESQLKIYEEQASESQEAWMKDHDAAMQCLDFEGHIAFGLSVLDFVHRLDEAWRTKVYKNLLDYDEDVSKAIDALYAWWLRPCPRVMERLKGFENEGFVVSGAKQFRSACKEVEAIVRDPREVFSSASLVELRDRAIDASRRGDVVEMKELGD
jgi:hypothetical protein